MKELSIEEKAKAYDEVLERVRSLSCSSEYEGYKKIFENIFPELAESEDEKIRKALIKLVKKAGEGYENISEGISIQKAIAWLEKQGEQKQVEVRPFNKVFSQEQIDEIDKRIEKEIKLYNAKLMDAQMRAKDFPMTD